MEIWLPSRRQLERTKRTSMRIVDLMDLRLPQYRSFKSIVAHGCSALGIPYIVPGTFEPLSAIVQSSDIVLLPPYGRALNAVRNGGSDISNPTLLVDLRGPMGIDSAFMLADRLRGRVSYLSPIYGQVAFDDFFSTLKNRIPCYPLPFFPHPSLIEETGLLRRFDSDERSTAGTGIAFAGAVWGRRHAFAESALKAWGSAFRLSNNLLPRQYVAFLQGSRACIDLAGTNGATYRFSEIFLLCRPCLCEQRPFFVLGRAPQHGKEILYFRTPEDMVKLGHFLLEDPDAALDIARRGFSWFRSTQNPSALVRYLERIALGRLPAPSCVDTSSCVLSEEVTCAGVSQ